MEEKILLKDQLFNDKSVKKITEEIKRVYSEFDDTHFTKIVLDNFPSLELSKRIYWISEKFREFLPDDYEEALKILLKSLPPHHDDNLIDSDFGNFMYAPYSNFVAKYGCNKKDLRLSLKSLREMTKRFSAEDAIRYFINAFPNETFEELLKWSKDTDYHVRRLTSEGTRPKLPWSRKINTAPEKAISLLDNLFLDKSRFVTRSVANHMNDISKIDTKLLFETLKKWQKSGKQKPSEMEYIINQSLRTLIKKGDKDSIRFLNLSPDPMVEISTFSLKENSFVIGKALEFELVIVAKKDEQLLIDYVIYFQNKAGNGYNKKVFKIKKVSMKKNQKMIIKKIHPMKNISTRKLFPGNHKLEIQINGKTIAEKSFILRG